MTNQAKELVPAASQPEGRLVVFSPKGGARNVAWHRDRPFEFLPRVFPPLLRQLQLPCKVAD
jgi:hypothetical protein